MAMDLIDTGDLWKYKFRALQLRLRDRLRVAVDKHWHRNRLGIISEGYFSSTIQRLALRVRNLREESLPAASKFYRKRVNKDALEDSALVRMVQAVAVPVLGNVCHVFMNGLNHIQVYGVEKLHEALLRRPEGKPLITVSNHVASVDDPFVIASLVPPNVMLDARNLRWTLCATDRCFKNPVTSTFFRSVKVLPVSRGDGIYQNGMDMALSKLNNGGWVHIFPEGSRSRDGGRTMGSTKRGVGRLVMDADKIPIVLPFVHTGMQDIMPIGANFPRIGQMVTVLIGDPIDFSDLLAADNESIPRGKLYDAVASRIGQRLHELKVQVDRLALERSIKLQNYHFQNAERATGIFQEVDWEAFGMGTYILAEDEGSSSLIKVIQTERNLNLDQEPSSPPPTSDRYFRVGFGLSRDEGIMSRVRGYMDPTDLMGFAARGMFINSRTQKENLNTSTAQEVGPLKVWKQFFEANIFHQWDCR